MEIKINVNYEFYLITALIIFTIGCREKQDVEIQNFEESAVEFLKNRVLAKPMAYAAIANEPFYKNYFSKVEFKEKKFYIYDSICHWSYEITDVERPGNLQPFSCYSFSQSNLIDISSISIEGFKNIEDSYLIILSRPIEYDEGQYIMLSLYPTNKKEHVMLFFITNENNKLDLGEVGIAGSDLETLFLFD